MKNLSSSILLIFGFLKKAPIVFVSFPLFWYNTKSELMKWNLKGSAFVSEGFLKSGVLLEFPSVFFMFFVATIGSAVLIFSMYYMPSNEISLFSWMIYLFMVLMIMLTMSINLITMFFGWEGVGVMSFILIGWFSSREDAVSGAKKAVLFNRFTDFFFLLLLIIELGELFSFFNTIMSKDFLTLNNNYFMFLLISISIIFSISGKSAQFMFHPWLTAAMEGPTPVSSLLHSSTMVVAGVWLLYMISPFLESSDFNFTSLIILSISSLTLVGSSIWALSQFDLKKIVALSTTSQLSFMMMLIIMGYPDLGFFHMICHGFFKALIFMGSGVSIHSLSSSSQDIRKISSSKSNSFLSIFFLLGNLGLMGIPFWGGFFSKHLMLNVFIGLDESMITSFFFMLILFFSGSLTISYSLKSVQVMYMNKSMIDFKKEKSVFSNNFFSEIFPTFSLSFLVIFFFYFLNQKYFSLSFHWKEMLAPKVKMPLMNYDFFFLLSLGVSIFFLSKSSSFNLSFFFSSVLIYNLSFFSKKIFKTQIQFLTEGYLSKTILKKSLNFFWKEKDLINSSFLSKDLSSNSWNFNLMLFFISFLLLLLYFL
uniref:NADH:ubiquinone reductase (H(+)-translocating) n=1 Tax=Symsagittifera roscoffensis TaxID=84072 RepID=E3UFE5_SYMRO|nr:NADH dehydrogenase subunit 5 [Symsagittifera roscoffensis]ADI75244.1 NADH dehydrogenase subunit 5 [Symsagittifera roscoffensis]